MLSVSPCAVATLPPCHLDPLHPVIRYGSFTRQSGEIIPRFYCKACQRKFIGQERHAGSWYPARRVVEALTLYYNGQSFGNVKSTFFDLYSERISKETLWNWVMDFSRIG